MRQFLLLGGVLAAACLLAACEKRVVVVAPLPAPAPAMPPPAADAPPPFLSVEIANTGPARDVCPGEDVTFTAHVTGAGTAATSFQWLVNGRPVAGAISAAFRVPTVDGSGTKSVQVRVLAANRETTSAAAIVTVLSLSPPTIRFSVTPATIEFTSAPIQLAAVAQAANRCNGPLVITYSGAGVTGNRFDPAAVGGFDLTAGPQQKRTITLTATAVDGRGQRASATQTIILTLGTAGYLPASSTSPAPPPAQGQTPPPARAPNVNSTQVANQALAGLTSGRLVWNPPPTMKVGVPTVIEARLVSLSSSDASAVRDMEARIAQGMLRPPGAVENIPKVSNSMDLVLNLDGKEIARDGVRDGASGSQPVEDDELIYWRWTVTPTEAGARNLSLAVHMIATIAGSQQTQTVKDLNATVQVEPNLTSWIEGHWKEITGLLSTLGITPWLVGLVKKRLGVSSG